MNLKLSFITVFIHHKQTQKYTSLSLSLSLYLSISLSPSLSLSISLSISLTLSQPDRQPARTQNLQYPWIYTCSVKYVYEIVNFAD